MIKMADDAGIIFEIEKLLKDDFQDLKENFPDKSDELMSNANDGIGEIIRGAMISESPFLWGDLRWAHTVEDIGPLEKYIFSDVPHFEPIVKGHVITGVNNSERQRRWWFWYVHNELGGEYSPKYGTGNKTPENDYPSRALINADSDIDERLQRFLDEVWS